MKRYGTPVLPRDNSSTQVIGTEAARPIDSICKDTGGSWNEETNGYQFPTAAGLQQILEGTPRPSGNRLATYKTPKILADRMRELLAAKATT